MENLTPEEIIEAYKKSNDQEEVEFANYYLAFIETDSISKKSKIPKINSWSHQTYLMEKASSHFDTDPVLRNIFLIAIALIKQKNYDNQFVGKCFNINISAHTNAIQFSKNNGLSNLEVAIAFCSFCSSSTSIDFGWHQDPQSYFGAEEHIGDSYFIPSESKPSYSPLEELILSLNNTDTLSLLTTIKPQSIVFCHATLAQYHPKKYALYLDYLVENNFKDIDLNWQFIIRVADQLDDKLMAYAAQAKKSEQIYIYTYIDYYREGSCRALAIEATKTSSCQHSLTYLSTVAPQEATETLYRIIKKAQRSKEEIEAECVLFLGFRAAAKIWKKVKKDPFAAILLPTIKESSLWHYQSYAYKPVINQAFKAILEESSISEADTKAWLKLAINMVNEADVNHTQEIFQLFDEHICAIRPHQFEEKLWSILQQKSKNTRSHAVAGLKKVNTPEVALQARELLSAKKMDARIGAIELLTELESLEPKDSNIPALKDAYATEKSAKVKDLILKSLHSLGCEDITPEGEEAPETIEELLKSLKDQAKKIKLPKAPWLDLSSLAPLTGSNGKQLPELFITYLIQHQAKHKTIDASPLINPLLEFIDTRKSSSFANDLLAQWLSSEQEAKDRWVLALAGLLGNDSIITTLEPKIDPWCRNSRHKLAEYAAQSISLLASDSALMVLDSLKNRYSSKFKNVGRSCAAAFDAAAVARGVSVDELADMIVPNLGFNDENQRPFETVDSDIVAILQPDFKLTWLNTTTEKETKSPPSTLSAEAKAEIKDLRKLIRTATKAQDMRLEQSLVTQRRWPVRRWQELFEDHPLLTSYASRLVWGIYNKKNKLLRTFRRYDNGILATGGGEMEDLEENDTTIGILHPLELDEATKNEWLEHLGRFKIKPPFPQLERPIELLDSNHGNRRQITLTDKISMSVGTFRSRSEKRNWNRGSVIDAGGVSSYYKIFAGAGVEVILETEDHWVAQDPMDYLTLGKALFAKLASVDRGSYIYDDPNPDDPRVLPFSEVPAIVYSETISDLKAIIEGQSS